MIERHHLMSPLLVKRCSLLIIRPIVSIILPFALPQIWKLKLLTWKFWCFLAAVHYSCVESAFQKIHSKTFFSFFCLGCSHFGRFSQFNFGSCPRFSSQRFKVRGSPDEGGRGHHRAVQGWHQKSSTENFRIEVGCRHISGMPLFVLALDLYHFLETKAFRCTTLFELVLLTR